MSRLWEGYQGRLVVERGAWQVMVEEVTAMLQRLIQAVPIGIDLFLQTLGTAAENNTTPEVDRYFRVFMVSVRS